MSRGWHGWPVARSRFSWSRQETTRTSVSARECLAVAGRRETVRAGLEVIADDGNAVDTAVCMGFVAAVVEPTEASIGGSGFMLVHDAPSGEAWSVEFPPRAPLAAHEAMFEPVDGAVERRLVGVVPVRGDANATGFLAPCVPGVVAGLCVAHRRFGRLPLPRLLEPAIQLADAGFEVDDYLTLQTLDNLEALRGVPPAARIFLRDGLPLVARFALPSTAPEVPCLRQPELAEALRAVAAHGPDGFYQGRVAAAIAEAFAERGGLISRADLASYEATVERPVEGRYRGWRALAPRAPSGASTVLRALEILERSPLSELEVAAPPRLRLIAEALQVAFAERYSSGGCDVGHGTTHLNVVDPDGRLVSCTLTLGNTFGSKVVADGTGVLFDSGMAWFDPRPGTSNSIAPGKRPLVNMAPLLMLGEGGARFAVGAAGGRRIISAVTQVVSAIVDHGLSPQAAVSAPRLDASDTVIRLSDRFQRSVQHAFQRDGYRVQVVREEHAPFSYELARSAVAAIDDSGLISGGIPPFCPGFVAGR